jgi:hypothetical protein
MRSFGPAITDLAQYQPIVGFDFDGGVHCYGLIQNEPHAVLGELDCVSAAGKARISQHRQLNCLIALDARLPSPVHNKLIGTENGILSL